MIEIKCTATEKKRLMAALNQGMSAIDDAICLFPRKAAFCLNQPDTDCDKCIASKIKWTVTKARHEPTGRKKQSQDPLDTFGSKPTDCQRRWIRNLGMNPDPARLLVWTPQVAVLFDTMAFEARTFKLME